jgi:GR25 family glycosyltransferase involved in LPS biosynthesis
MNFFDEFTSDIEKKILFTLENYKVTKNIVINDKNNEKFINNVIEKIYIINLETCKIRRNYITLLMKKYQINYELIIVPQIDDDIYRGMENSMTRGEYGCYLSHLYCFFDSIINNYNNIIIFEDDIILHKRFHKMFEEVFTETKFDILFLGLADFDFSRLNKSFINKNHYIPNDKSRKMLATYSIFYTQFAIKKIFRFKLKQPSYFDKYLIDWKKEVNKSMAICYPNLTQQDLSTSSIDHNFWVTNIRSYDNYINNCYDGNANFRDYNGVCLKLFEYFNKENIKKDFRDLVYEVVTQGICVNIFDQKKVFRQIEYSFLDNKDLEFILNN